MIDQLNGLRERVARRGEDERGVALLMAILFMVVMAGISTVLVSVVLSQLYPTDLAQKSTKTIYAAQAGLQTALGLIRSATDGGGIGDLTELPCAASGNVNGALTDGVTYSAAINYFTVDPTGKDSTWQNANKLACSASGVTVQPAFALVVSQGVAPAIKGSTSSVGNRSLSAIYKFKITSVNVPGGRIYDSSKGYCLHAVSAAAGSLVQFTAAAGCTSDALELWIYDTDYKIKLSSTTAGGAAGMCITGPVNYGEDTQNAKLQPCKSAIDPLRWNQLWSWTGSAAWKGQTPDTSANSAYCLATGYNAGTALTGKYLQVSNGCNGPFEPTPQIGAGAASYGTHQIVNFKEFGRCADVTNEQIGFSYMIVYPCKQDPSGQNQLFWNHKWFYTEPPSYSDPTNPATSLANQQIYVYNGNGSTTKYCLTTPTAGNGNYPIFALCSTSVQQTWTRVYNTGTYATSYVFVDSSNRCLTADSTDQSGGWSKMTVAACNGSDAQKWNAPATYTESTVAGYKEVGP